MFGFHDMNMPASQYDIGLSSAEGKYWPDGRVCFIFAAMV